MIMKCTSCGLTYDSAYGHYNCITQVSGPDVTLVPVEVKPILPVEVIESWDLTYNLGVAIDKVGKFAFDGNLEYLEDAIRALRREIIRVGGNR